MLRFFGPNTKHATPETLFCHPPTSDPRPPTPLLARFIAAAALFTAVGCGADVPGATVVELWAMGREGEMVQRLVPAFEERHPGVRVRVQQIPWSAAHEKLLTAYVGEAMPDVFQLGNTWIPELAALAALEPLDAWLERDRAAVPLADYFPGILDTNRLAGQLYALPWYVDTRLLFYRSDLLRAAGYATAPTTWTGWRDALQRVQRIGSQPYGIVLPMTEWQLPIILALQAGAPLLRGDGEYGDFRAPSVRAAFDFYLSFFQLGMTPTTAQTTNLYRDFVNGDFACFVSGPWSIGELRARAPADFDRRWATAPLPDLRGDGIGVSLAGGASLAMFAGSPRKEAAWQWIAFLSQPEQQSEFFRLTGDLPARASAWESEPIATDPYIGAFRRQLEQVHATPKVPEWERIASKVSQHMESLARNTTSVEVSLAALDAEVDAILAKRRWMLQQQALRPKHDGGT